MILSVILEFSISTRTCTSVFKAGNLKSDMKSKLERSRQSARECRARKKLRYQYLDDLILVRSGSPATSKIVS